MEIDPYLVITVSCKKVSSQIGQCARLHLKQIVFSSTKEFADYKSVMCAWPKVCDSKLVLDCVSIPRNSSRYSRFNIQKVA